MIDRYASAESINEVFWIILRRAAHPLELRDENRRASGGERTLVTRLLSSPEFDTIRAALHGGTDKRDRDELERGLQTVGSDERFVQRAYECLLGRSVDDDGFLHYTAALAAGDRRADVLAALVESKEFHRRFDELAPQSGVVPQDVQLCELVNPAKWDNEAWLEILRSLGLSDDKRSMHRKPYEFTQLIFGCRRLGVLRDDSSVLSVGAGHELVLYWLANHTRRVVATDLYEGVWQKVQGQEGDPDVIQRPEDYAPFPYRRDHLVFMKMDGRRLAFRNGVFDVAYSLSSIEHFGGNRSAAATIREMARVLKPGGVLALATEYVLQGPRHEETFRPDEFRALIEEPTLELVQPLDDQVFNRYEYAAIDLYKNPYQTPHLVVRFNDTVFTTVMVFLRKR